MLTTLSRLIRYGYQNFIRNGWLSVATVAVMFLALMFFLGLILFRFITISTLDTVKDKIDISVYFRLDAPEDDILQVKKVLEDVNEVKSITYISRDQALEDFKVLHQNDSAAEALTELDDNPFLASLNIKANNPNQYSIIANYFADGSWNGLIEKVTFAENQVVIERLTSIIDNVNKGGLVLTFILALIAVLVAFNTIWLAMYSNREEISIMRLVGASNMYIRGPYVVEGIIYGIFAAILSIIVAVPIVITINPWLSNIEQSLEIKNYFFSDLGSLILYQLFFGILLGAISSFIAIRRYLKV